MPNQSWPELFSPEEEEVMPESYKEKEQKGFWGRLDHPIFGAFIASWIICNWEIPYLVGCGVKTPEQTINEIYKDHLNLAHWFPLTLLPLVTTTFYLLLGPYLHERYILYKKWIRAKVMDTEPILKREYIQMQTDLKREQEERRIIEGAYNLIRDKQVTLPPFSGHPNQQKIEAKQVMQTYFYNQEEVAKLRSELAQLKADKLELEKKIPTDSLQEMAKFTRKPSLNSDTQNGD